VLYIFIVLIRYSTTVMLVVVSMNWMSLLSLRWKELSRCEKVSCSNVLTTLLSKYACVFIGSTRLSMQAYIATLLGRLEANEGRFWSLLVKINDGTATLDVVISDQVYYCWW